VPNYGSAVISGTTQVVYTPTNRTAGYTAVFTYTASDGSLSDTATVTVTVSADNDAPTFTSTPVTAATEDAAYIYSIATHDVDAGAILTVTAPTLPAWLTLIDHGDGTATLSGTPAHADIGDHSVVLQVTDGTETATQSFTITVSEKPIYYVYLPQVLRSYVVAPDLVVDSITAASNDVQVVIKNEGNAPVTDEFWVDVYINPNPVPTHVNQVWPDLGSQGLVWGVMADALPLAPGESLTLTVGGDHYVAGYSQVHWPLAEGTAVYAQADSANADTTYGGVLEDHEVTGGTYNNISGTDSTLGVAGGIPPSVDGEERPVSTGDLPPRR
jgi:hypothetical protein